MTDTELFDAWFESHLSGMINTPEKAQMANVRRLKETMRLSWKSACELKNKEIADAHDVLNETRNTLKTVAANHKAFVEKTEASVTLLTDGINFYASNDNKALHEKVMNGTRIILGTKAKQILKKISSL